jgi:hypothetical protein
MTIIEPTIGDPDIVYPILMPPVDGLVLTIKPADTDTHVNDCVIAEVDGHPTTTWVARLRNAAEMATVNERKIKEQALAAMEFNAAFLADETPTQAEVLAQVRLLTQENNKIIRLLLGALEGTE